MGRLGNRELPLRMHCKPHLFDVQVQCVVASGNGGAADMTTCIMGKKPGPELSLGRALCAGMRWA